MTTAQLPVADVEKYDYVIIGGGTAGCVLGARLAEYLPHKNVLLIEAGPSDFMDDRVLNLREWLKLLGGELDYDYGTTEQPMGKSRIDSSWRRYKSFNLVRRQLAYPTLAGEGVGWLLLPQHPDLVQALRV